MKQSTFYNVIGGVWLCMGLINFNNPVWLAGCLIMSAVYGVRSDIALLTEVKEEVCDAPGNDDLME